MLKIYTNHNKQDVVYSFKFGGTFPEIEGKLLKVEANGNELEELLVFKGIPVSTASTSYLVWEGKFAGSILKTFRELLNSNQQNSR